MCVNMNMSSKNPKQTNKKPAAEQREVTWEKIAALVKREVWFILHSKSYNKDIYDHI